MILPVQSVTLKQFAEMKGIYYRSAWRILQKGRLKYKRMKNGKIAVFGEKTLKGPSGGRPSNWTKEKVLNAVDSLCKDQYVNAKDFPRYLYVLCRKYYGTVRSAKWKAGLIRDMRNISGTPQLIGEPGLKWDIMGAPSKKSFLGWVNSYCKDSYKKPSQWPGYKIELAMRHCGSVRKAKWEARILKEQRKRKSGITPIKKGL